MLEPANSGPWRGYIPGTGEEAIAPRSNIERTLPPVPTVINDRFATPKTQTLSVSHPSLYAAVVASGRLNEELTIVGVDDAGDRVVLRRTVRSRDRASLTFSLLERSGRSWRETVLLRRYGGDYWTNDRFRVEPIDLSADGRFLLYSDIKARSFFSGERDRILSAMDTHTGESVVLKSLSEGESTGDSLSSLIEASLWFRTEYPDAFYDEMFRKSGQRCLAANSLEAVIDHDSNLIVRKGPIPAYTFSLRRIVDDPSVTWESTLDHFNSADCTVGLMTVSGTSPLSGIRRFLLEFGIQP